MGGGSLSVLCWLVALIRYTYNWKIAEHFNAQLVPIGEGCTIPGGAGHIIAPSEPSLFAL